MLLSIPAPSMYKVKTIYVVYFIKCWLKRQP
jgi:hypothetical protein